MSVEVISAVDFGSNAVQIVDQRRKLSTEEVERPEGTIPFLLGNLAGFPASNLIIENHTLNSGAANQALKREEIVVTERWTSMDNDESVTCGGSRELHLLVECLARFNRVACKGRVALGDGRLRHGQVL